MMAVAALGASAALMSGCVILGTPSGVRSIPGGAWSDQVNSVVVGDVTRDGKPDVVAAHSDASFSAIDGRRGVSILPGDGAGGFGAASVTFGFPASLARLGDIDADGFLDVVRCCSKLDGTARVVVALSRPGGMWNETASSFDVTPGAIDVAVGDFVQTGLSASPPDVALLYGDGTVRIYANLGFATPTLAATVPPPPPPGGSAGWQATNLTQLRSPSALTTLAYGLNAKDAGGALTGSAAVTRIGGFTPPFDSPAPVTTAVNGPKALFGVAGGDLDGDGAADDLAASSLSALTNGQVGVTTLLPTGAATFAERTTLTPNQGYRPGTPVVADLDSDGKGDVALYSPKADGFYVVGMTGKGDGSFCGGNGTFGVNTALPAPLRSQDNNRYPLAVAGDLTGDGKPDLVAGTAEIGAARILKLPNASVANCPGG